MEVGDGECNVYFNIVAPLWQREGVTVVGSGKGQRARQSSQFAGRAQIQLKSKRNETKGNNKLANKQQIAKQSNENERK